MRKPHPCGGYDWQVTRLGADIGLRCLTCDRRLLLDRTTLEKRTKEFVFRARAAASMTPGPERPGCAQAGEDEPETAF